MFLRLRNIIKFTQVSRSICQSTVRLHDDATSKDISGSVSTKFQVFRNETGIVFDIEEERRRQDENTYDPEETFPLPYEGINLERGVSGVYEIEDLVKVLKRENAKKLFVIKVPSDLKYVDYLCLVNGHSYRHMLGMAQFVRKVYKMKRQKGDIIPKIEGEKSKDWMALDLGNIALHIFSKGARKEYDLESLWCLGLEYEKRIHRKSASEEIYQKYLNAAGSPNFTEITKIPANTNDKE